MTVLVLVLVFGAAILLTSMLVHSYSRREGSPGPRRAERANAGYGGNSAWMFVGSGTSASDCSAGDSGGGCGDGGGGGGGGE